MTWRNLRQKHEFQSSQKLCYVKLGYQILYAVEQFKWFTIFKVIFAYAIEIKVCFVNYNGNS